MPFNIIYKYEITPPAHGYNSKVWMPRNHKILSVSFQGDKIVVWALVDSVDSDKEYRDFFVIPTGVDISEHYHSKVFIGTVQLPYGLVFHIFGD